MHQAVVDFIHNENIGQVCSGYFKVALALCCSLQEIDAFQQEFLSVVHRLPSCISSLQTLSRLPLPSTFRELQHFCSDNEAKFQQLRRSCHSRCAVPFIQQCGITLACSVGLTHLKPITLDTTVFFLLVEVKSPRD